MKKHQLLYALFTLSLFSIIIFIACSKGSSATPPADPCAGVTITVSGTTTDADAGTSNGSITATAAGSTNFTFSINGGTAQTSGTFSNLAAGTYKIVAKNANGCSGTFSFAIKAKDACAGAAGPKFTAVKAVLLTNCAVSGCHNGTQPPDYTVECNIVAYADLIKIRTIDDANTADQMPQPPRAALAQADKDKITAWIAAGKRYTD